MRSLWKVAVVLAAVGCKDEKKPEARRGLDAACAAALASGDAAESLRRCTPCGVSWEPLIALSSTDPDTVPERLPGPIEVFEVLDACGATCQGTARTEVAELLRSAQDGHTPAAPWRRMAERCDGALRAGGDTLRCARGTWYAFDQIARAIWAEGAPPAIAALRERPPVFPLPPLTAASTGYAMPRTDQLATWRPRLHLTITEAQVHVGALPYVVLGKSGPELELGPAGSYPGREVTADKVGPALAAMDGGGRPGPVVIAPRALGAARVLEVIAGLDGPVHLGATPKTRGADPWPEPVYAIPVALSPRPDGAEPLVLPASSRVADLADALAGLAARGVATAYVTLDPLSSP